MAGLTLVLRISSPDVLRGAALRVKLAMKNEGTAEMELPDPRLVSPFGYTLKPATGQGAVRKLSSQAAIVARYPDARAPPPKFMRLRPGESFETGDDLAQLAVPPLAPGRYLLTAELLNANPKLASGEVAVAVVVPDVRPLAAVDAGAHQSLAIAFVKRFALDPAKRPEQWAVQRQPAAGPASYEVVWVETSGPKSMIMRQTVAPEQPTQPRAQPLLRPDKPILALALAAVGLPVLRMVDAVLRSDDERGQPALQLLSIPLDSGVKPAFWNLAMPPGAGDGSAVRWVVARTATQAPVVMAQVGQRFLIVQPSFDASWRPLADAAAGATLGRLVAVGNRLWAVWVEPEAGLRYRALP